MTTQADDFINLFHSQPLPLELYANQAEDKGECSCDMVHFEKDRSPLWDKFFTSNYIFRDALVRQYTFKDGSKLLLNGTTFEVL